MRRSEVQGAREDTSGAARGASFSRFGNLTGVANDSAGVANNTGGFLSAGLGVVSGSAGNPLITDCLIDYVLFISSSAAAAGGVNFRMVIPLGNAIVSILGPAGSLLAPKFAPVGVNAASIGPFVTFDASVNLASVWIRATCVGLNIPGTIDLQFQNVVGAETYSVVVTSSVLLTRMN